MRNFDGHEWEEVEGKYKRVGMALGYVWCRCKKCAQEVWFEGGGVTTFGYSTCAKRLMRRAIG